MNDLACGCQYDEYEIRTEVCRACAIALEQGSEEWEKIRLGKLTASRFSDAIARTKSGWGASRANYRAELICERLSGLRYEGYTNFYMDRGNRVEPEAVTAYELFVGLGVEQCGFFPHPTIPMAGASPDRLVGEDGQIEAKCRTTAIHFDLLLTHTILDKFIAQMQFSLACTGRSWCDFVSYDPRAPADYSLFVKRIYRDEQRIAELEQQGIVFLAEVDEHAQALKNRADAGFIFTGQNGDYGLTKQLEDSLEIARKPNVVHARKRRMIELVK